MGHLATVDTALEGVGSHCRGTTEQHVGKAAVQPSFTAGIVVSAVDGFFQYVRVVTAETGDFLMQPISNMSHKVVVTVIPDLVTMREITLHALTARFDDVLAQRLGIEGRQVAMPEDDLPFVVGLTHNHTVSE